MESDWIVDYLCSICNFGNFVRRVVFFEVILLVCLPIRHPLTCFFFVTKKTPCVDIAMCFLQPKSMDLALQSLFVFKRCMGVSKNSGTPKLVYNGKPY